MGKIIMYSTGCPKCKILERKLHEAGYEFYISTSTKEMESLGIEFVPVLFVDGKMLHFSEAVKWIADQKSER